MEEREVQWHLSPCFQVQPNSELGTRFTGFKCPFSDGPGPGCGFGLGLAILDRELSTFILWVAFPNQTLLPH